MRQQQQQQQQDLTEIVYLATIKARSIKKQQQFNAIRHNHCRRFTLNILAQRTQEIDKTDKPRIKTHSPLFHLEFLARIMLSVIFT